MATLHGFRLGGRNNSHEPLYEFFMNSWVRSYARSCPMWSGSLR